MAGNQITTSVTIISSLNGWQALSLTNFTASAECLIAAGSKLEIGSAFFTFGSDETIVGFAGITTAATAYIEATPAGSAGNQTVTAAWTETVPVWRDALQAWYASATSIVRTVGAAYKSGPTSCENAAILDPKQQIVSGAMLRSATFPIGDWDMDATASVSVAHGVVGSSIRSATAFIRKDSDEIQPDEVYDIRTGESQTTIQGHVWVADGGLQITLSRVGAGFFDDTKFDATSFNRGWITIWYTA